MRAPALQFHFKRASVLLIMAASMLLSVQKSYGAQATPTDRTASEMDDSRVLAAEKADYQSQAGADFVTDQRAPQGGNASSRDTALPAAAQADQRAMIAASLADAEQIIRGALHVDISAYQARFARGDLTRYSAYANYADVFMDLSDALKTTVDHAIEQCMPLLSQNFRSMSVPLYPTDAAALSAPGWKTVAALFYAFGDELPQKLAESMRIRFISADGKGQSLSISFGTLEEIASLGDQTQHLHAKFAIAYLNTVYDELGTPVLTKKHTYPNGYIDGIANPLPGCLIKNCWFDPRDQGSRLHTGADIRADARTPILSVTDGVVTYIGKLPVPGNYAVVLDPYGYEYHYYHMYEQTELVRVGDTVKAGQPIGRVGSTGNSAANHLHLAIISPEQTYLNPYDLFMQAGFEPIRIDS